MTVFMISKSWSNFEQMPSFWGDFRSKFSELFGVRLFPIKDLQIYKVVSTHRNGKKTARKEPESKRPTNPRDSLALGWQLARNRPGRVSKHQNPEKPRFNQRVVLKPVESGTPLPSLGIPEGCFLCWGEIGRP